MTIDRNCLDAETVAAWLDGGLDAAGVAAAEAHASTCERCQALLATVTSTMPVADIGQVSAGSRLWRWWLAPIAATAAAVTIWAVVPQTPMQPPAATQIARDMADAPAKAQPPAAPAEFAPEPPATATPPPPARDNSRRNVPAQKEAQNTLADTAANAAKLDAEALGRKDGQGKREEGKALAEMRQAAEPAPAAAAERMREASASARDQAGELRRDKPAAPGVGAVSQLRKQVPLEIVSPDPLSRWRATVPGTIERSEDGGRIWIAVRILAKEEVLAGAAPGRLVCWLVGRNGLVMLATDGTNFTRLPFPESVDLVAVSSPEPRIAIVTTADGRTFRTENTGRSWSLQDFLADPF